MLYVHAKAEEYERELSYKIYVTDSLQGAAQSKYITQRWADLLKAPDTRTGDEIALEVIASAGLVVNPN